jgi:hypothetical protein
MNTIPEFSTAARGCSLLQEVKLNFSASTNIGETSGGDE